MDKVKMAEELVAMAERMAALPAEQSDYAWVSDMMGELISKMSPMRSRMGLMRQKREWDKGVKGSLVKIIGLLDEAESEMEDLRDLADVTSNKV